MRVKRTIKNDRILLMKFVYLGCSCTVVTLRSETLLYVNTSYEQRPKSTKINQRERNFVLYGDIQSG